MKYYLNGKEVEITQTSLQIGEGVQVRAANFVDSDIELTDDQYRDLEDKYQSELYLDAYSTLCDAAHSSMEDR